MKKEFLDKKAIECIQLIKSIDYNALNISEYNTLYINKLTENIEYYFNIYKETVLLLEVEVESKSSSFIIDFGGGHGFLSLFLKSLGLNVIYCDKNPLSADTVTKIKQKINIGPDVIIEGSIPELLTFCQKNNIKPNYLIATDLIEHIFDLNVFFGNLIHLNSEIKMVFTTGSNPYNYLKAQKLYKMMRYEENTYHLPKRLQYITQNYSDLSNDEIKILAKVTRGYTFGLIDNAILIYKTKKELPKEIEAYNTCNPETGEWEERILNFRRYRQIVNNINFRVTFHNGFYNTIRNNLIIGLIMHFLNLLIKSSSYFGRYLAPYIILKIYPILKKNN